MLNVWPPPKEGCRNITAITLSRAGDSNCSYQCKPMLRVAQKNVRWPLTVGIKNVRYFRGNVATRSSSTRSLMMIVIIINLHLLLRITAKIGPQLAKLLAPSWFSGDTHWSSFSAPPYDTIRYGTIRYIYVRSKADGTGAASSSARHWRTKNKEKLKTKTE